MAHTIPHTNVIWQVCLAKVYNHSWPEQPKLQFLPIIFFFFLPDFKGFICTHCMRPRCTRVSPHQGRKIVLNSNVYPLNKTIINDTWRQRKISTDVILYIVQQMVYGLMRGSLTILIDKCNKRFIVRKLLLEPSLKNKMHTVVTGKYILFFFFYWVKISSVW